MVVSITVFDEAPTKVTLSTLLKSSVPWGVAIGIVSTIWGGFFKRKSPEDGTSASHLELGFLQSGLHFGGNLFTKLERRAKRDSLDLRLWREDRGGLGGNRAIPVF